MSRMDDVRLVHQILKMARDTDGLAAFNRLLLLTDPSIDLLSTPSVMCGGGGEGGFTTSGPLKLDLRSIPFPETKPTDSNIPLYPEQSTDPRWTDPPSDAMTSRLQSIPRGYGVFRISDVDHVACYVTNRAGGENRMSAIRLKRTIDLYRLMPEARERPPAVTPEHPESFDKALERLINQHSRENASNTPDFILASYLIACLNAFDSHTRWRDKWSGFGSRMSQADSPPNPERSPAEATYSTYQPGVGRIPKAELPLLHDWSALSVCTRCGAHRLYRDDSDPSCPGWNRKAKQNDSPLEGQKKPPEPESNAKPNLEAKQDAKRMSLEAEMTANSTTEALGARTPAADWNGSHPPPCGESSQEFRDRTHLLNELLNESGSGLHRAALLYLLGNTHKPYDFSKLMERIRHIEKFIGMNDGALPFQT